jgi:hypothetical protein
LRRRDRKVIEELAARITDMVGEELPIPGHIDHFVILALHDKPGRP